jgi:hypothetical protein
MFKDVMLWPEGSRCSEPERPEEHHFPLTHVVQRFLGFLAHPNSKEEFKVNSG